MYAFSPFVPERRQKGRRSKPIYVSLPQAAMLSDTVASYTDTQTCTRTACPAHSNSSAQSPYCKCVANYYGDLSTTPNCTACPLRAISLADTRTLEGCRCSNGTYRNGSTCVNCPANSDSVNGSVARGDCKCGPGYFGNLYVNETCASCPGG